MDTNNQEFNFNDSYSIQQKNILEIFKTSYPQLSVINIDNNVLHYNNETIHLGRYHLSQLSTMICEMPPKEFFEIVKLLAYIENNLNNEDYYLFTISGLLTESTLNDNDKNVLMNFINQYFELQKYEDFLTGVYATTLSKYRQIVNNVLYLTNPNNLTVGQKFITEQILNSKEDLGGRSKPMVRVLTNPNAPNILQEDDQYFSKAGFASILFIIYSIINAAIILAIHMIK